MEGLFPSRKFKQLEWQPRLSAHVGIKGLFRGVATRPPNRPPDGGSKFRVYDDLVDDPKGQQLEPSLLEASINLWCLTSATNGVLPPIYEIAFKLRIKPQKARRVLDALKAAGLFEDDEKGTHPHNWEGRQYKSDVEDPTAAERMRRYVTSRVTAA